MFNWPTKKLSEICEVNYGTRIVKSRNKLGNYFVYGGGGKTFTTNTYNRENCVIVSRFGMSSNCVRKIQGKFYLNDSGLTVAPKKSKELSQVYLDWILFSLEGIIFDLGRGQAQRNLNVEGFKSLEIPLPSLEIQKKIVKRIEELFAKITQAQSLRNSAIQDTNNLIPATISKIFKEGKLKGWEEINFGLKKHIEIIDGDRGKNYPKKSDFTNSGYCLFLNTSNVRHGSFDFVKCDFISKERDEILRKGKLKRGDVVLTTRGTLGNSAYYDESVPYDNLRLNSGMVILRVNPKELLQRFLLYVLNSPTVIERIEEANSGSAQPQLPIRVLSKIHFILPPLPEQKKIVARMDALTQKVRQLQKLQSETAANLTALKQSVLHKAFQGELIN